MLAGLLVLAAGARQARGAAEVHRLNLVLSVIPTQVTGGDFNEELDFRNRAFLQPRGLESVPRITYAWYYQAELRFLVRPNLALVAGTGQIRNQTTREYLPALQEDIQLRAEILSVPVHVGAAYYLQAYNQGDFQARAYLGGGFLSLVNNRVQFQRFESVSDSSRSLRRWTEAAYTGDGPGFYLEAGVHMFFAVRYSVLLGAVYRDSKIAGMLDRTTHQPVLAPDGAPFRLDVSGVGARMALAYGF